MTTTAIQPKLQGTKPIKKKDLSNHPIDIGTPQVPLRQLAMQQEHELLCDWEDAS